MEYDREIFLKQHGNYRKCDPDTVHEFEYLEDRLTIAAWGENNNLYISYLSDNTFSNTYR